MCGDVYDWWGVRYILTEKRCSPFHWQPIQSRKRELSPALLNKPFLSGVGLYYLSLNVLTDRLALLIVLALLPYLPVCVPAPDLLLTYVEEEQHQVVRRLLAAPLPESEVLFASPPGF